MRLRLTAAAILLALLGCHPNNPQSQPSPPAASNTTSIRVGMDLDEAMTKLKACGATPHDQYQVSVAHRGDKLHFFKLPTEQILSVTAEPISNNHFKIARMSVSAYPEPDWTSKLDPERTKFFASFRSVQELDCLNRHP